MLLATGDGGRLVGMWKVAAFSGVLSVAVPILMAAVEPRVLRRESEERRGVARREAFAAAPLEP